MSEQSTPQPPPQQQPYPGYTERMVPRPRDEMRDYQGRGLLDGRCALVTGGDSGIGRAVSVVFAKEGADVAVAYLSEDEDADHTAKLVRGEGRRCHLIRGDLADEDHCTQVVAETVRELGRLDVLINHAGTQAPADDLTEISTEQWDRTFKVNVYSMFWVTRAALPHLPDGGAIVNTGSVNGLRGNGTLIDYSATKGAIHIFTYALAKSLAQRGIRVNCVAPGPVWTPMIPATLPADKVERFGEQVPVSRWAHPDEIAPSYVFLASGQLSSYYTGQVLSPIGGETHPG
ncbi:MAG: SDR family oxidoreductase [Streptosporangiales bacterium]|nr:SDR family oxidoreductase [Streptosporangiales bacterium]